MESTGSEKGKDGKGGTEEGRQRCLGKGTRRGELQTEETVYVNLRGRDNSTESSGTRGEGDILSEHEKWAEAACTGRGRGMLGLTSTCSRDPIIRSSGVL